MVNATPNRGDLQSLLLPTVVSLTLYEGGGMYLWKVGRKRVGGNGEEK